MGEYTMRLVDRYGREHRDLRVSVTDRCPLRCSYCMPTEGITFMRTDDLLSVEEIQRLVGIATTLGIDKVRITGGEPLVRENLVEIVRAIATLPDPPDLAMTTSGVGLAKWAYPLAMAGLPRVNVSLDTIDPATFVMITRKDRFSEVLAGLDAAVQAGLVPIKINAVLQRGVNDHEASRLLDFAIERGCELRFIEQMPLSGQQWDRESIITGKEILNQIGATHRLTRVADRGHSPAELWMVDSGPARLGIIAAVTEPFCSQCDRLRLTADGYLRSCLFSTSEADLRSLMRRGASDDDLAEVFVECVSNKEHGHRISEQGFVQPTRPMSAIGG